MDDMHKFSLELNEDAVQSLVASLGVEPQDALIQTLFIGMSMVEAEKHYGLKIILRDDSDGSEWSYSINNEKQATAVEIPKSQSGVSSRHTIGNVIYFNFGRNEKDDEPT